MLVQDFTHEKHSHDLKRDKKTKQHDSLKSLHIIWFTTKEIEFHVLTSDSHYATSSPHQIFEIKQKRIILICYMVLNIDNSYNNTLKFIQCIIFCVVGWRQRRERRHRPTRTDDIYGNDDDDDCHKHHQCMIIMFKKKHCKWFKLHDNRIPHTFAFASFVIQNGTVNITGPPGQKGEQGIQGIKGEKGNAGLNGTKGQVIYQILKL